MSSDKLQLIRNPKFNKNSFSIPQEVTPSILLNTNQQTFSPYSSISIPTLKSPSKCLQSPSDYGYLVKRLEDVCGNVYELYKDITDSDCSIHSKSTASGTLCINSEPHDQSVIDINIHNEYVFITEQTNLYIKNCLTDFDCDLPYQSNLSVSHSNDYSYILADESAGEFNVYELSNDLVKKITIDPLSDTTSNVVDISYSNLFKTKDSFYVFSQLMSGHILLAEYYDNEWCGFVSDETFPQIIGSIKNDCSFEFFTETGNCPNVVRSYCFNLDGSEEATEEECVCCE